MSEKAFNELLNAIMEANKKADTVAYKDIMKYIKNKFIQVQKNYPLEK